MDEKTLKRQMSARWGLLIVDVILLLVLGLIYAWSVFRGPLMADLGDGVKSTFTITMITVSYTHLTLPTTERV